MRATFARFARVEQNTTAGTPRARAAYATPWPKLPADTHTTARSGPTLPSPASAAIATHVPRPLNERIGLTVSTLTTTGTPRRADRPSWTYWGVPVKTGSIRPWAARMAAGSRSGCAITARAARDMKTPEGTAGP